MAYTPLKISVPKPCHEDWAGMTPVADTTARHCDSCAKNVVDFTGFSDAQLHAYARAHPGKLCGRFRRDQLGRALHDRQTPNRTPLKAAATAAGLLLSAAAQAQSVPNPAPEAKPAKQPISVLHATPAQPGQFHVDVEITPEGDTIEVISPNPLPTAERQAPTAPLCTPRVSTEQAWPEADQIVTAGTTVGIAISPDQIHSLPVIDSFPDYPDPIIQSDGTGGEIITGDIEIRSVPVGPTLPDHPAVVGRVAVDAPPPPPPPMEEFPIMGFVLAEPPRPTGWQKVQHWFKNLWSASKNPAPDPSALHLPGTGPTAESLAEPLPEYLDQLSVSPNPMVNDLTLKIESPRYEELTIELTDVLGNVLLQRPWRVGKGRMSITLRPRLPTRAGMIYVRLMDENGAAVTRQVVVAGY